MKDPLLKVDVSENNKTSKTENKKEQQGSDRVKVLFSTSVHYSRTLLAFLLMALLFYVGVHVYTLDSLAGKKQKWEMVPETSPQREFVLGQISQLQARMKTTSMVLFSFLVALGFFLFPRSYSVYSDASLVVQTLLARYRFTGIRSAKRNPNWCDSVKRFRWDFSVDLQNRVFVKRAGNRFEVSCSPSDPDGFLAAIEQACGGGEITPTNNEESIV